MKCHISTKKNSEVQLLQMCPYLGLSTDWQLPQGQGLCCMLWDVSRAVCREDTRSICFVSQRREQCPAVGKNKLGVARYIYL